MADNSLIFKFRSLGLSDSQAKEYAKNKIVASNISALIDTLHLTEVETAIEGYSSKSRFDQKQASLISSLASSGSDLSTPEKKFVVDAIESRKLGSTDQVSGVFVLLLNDI